MVVKSIAENINKDRNMTPKILRRITAAKGN
jgi:hypothetical protein